MENGGGKARGGASERREHSPSFHSHTLPPPFLAVFSRSHLFLASPLFTRLEQVMVKTHGRPKRIVFTLVISCIGWHRHRRQHRKRHFLNEFALRQTLSLLCQFAENAKCRRIFHESTSWGPHSSIERERKIRRRVFMPSTKRAIRHFLVEVMQ